MTLRARCGLHAGECEARDGDYFGSAVNRAARIMAAASGGQVLVSASVAAAAMLPAGARLVDLGHVRLRDLLRPEHLFELAHPAVGGPFPPLESLDATPNNLPCQLTSFYGRDEEIVRVRDLLRESRLVTLTGPGGIGKTRLALQATAEVVHRHADGVWWVDLAPLPAGADVTPAVARVLGVRDDDGDPAAAVARHLAGRRTLLLLDNCEHVLPSCAAVGASLLAAAPSLAILATSREPLGLGGERTLLLGPLPLSSSTVDATAAPALRLFLDRARDQRPDAASTSADLAVAADIVRRLEGIPLALELAAARTRALSLTDIAARLSDRFALLSRGYRDNGGRQRTLAALLAWSHDLLGDDERRVFAALAVFAGGFDASGVREVCGGDGRADPVENVESLVAKSLVVAEDRGGAMRYRMLDTLREFAQMRLAQGGQEEPLRARHAAWCLALARDADAAMRGPQQAEWIDRLDALQDNLRAALRWTSADPARADEALALAARLWRFWHMTGRLTEGRAHLERALALAPEDATLAARADALYAAGALAKNQSDFAHAVRRLEDAAAAYRVQDRKRDAAAALGSLGNVRHDMGDLAAARALHEEALVLFRTAGDRAAEATALLNLGSVALDQGDAAAAVALHEQAIERARRLGLGAVEGMSEVNLGQLALDRGDHALAGRHLGKALEISRRVRFRVAEAMALANLGALALAAGDPPLAARHARDAITALDAAGSRGPLMDALDVAAEILAARGDLQAAAAIVAAVDAARAALALPVLPRARRLRERLGPLVTAARPSRALPPAEAVAAALAALAA